jgi:hypothetical protein
MTGTNWNGHRFFRLRQGNAGALGRNTSRRKSTGRATGATGRGAPFGDAPP